LETKSKKDLSLTLREMKKEKRVFTPEHRESILKEALREGKTETCRQYNLSPSLLRKWQYKYENSGLAGLSDRYKKVDHQAREVELENERLKRIVAKQALELEVMAELLKKTGTHPAKK
jgi:transposase-like protein